MMSMMSIKKLLKLIRNMNNRGTICKWPQVMFLKIKINWSLLEVQLSVNRETPWNKFKIVLKMKINKWILRNTKEIKDRFSCIQKRIKLGKKFKNLGSWEKMGKTLWSQILISHKGLWRILKKTVINLHNFWVHIY